MKLMLNILASLLLTSALFAEVPEGYQPMKPWPYGDFSKGGETAWLIGIAKKDGNVQTSKLSSFSITANPVLPRPDKMNWLELRQSDGRWLKKFCEVSIFRELGKAPEGDWESHWHAVFPAEGELTGYRLFINNELFAEEYFSDDSVTPSFKIWEPGPHQLAWSVKDANITTLLVDYSRDFAENWYGAGTMQAEGVKTFQDFAYKDAKHPFLIRVETCRNFKRFVGYYQIGKGYLSSPQKMGAPQGRW